MPEEKQKSKREEHIENLRITAKSTKSTIFLYIGVTIIKFVGGYVTNIIALLADAIGSISIVVSQIAIYIGLRASLKKADNQFQYGYHRLETFVTLCISLLILYAGYRAFKESFFRLFVPAETSSYFLAVGAALISMYMCVRAYKYDLKTSKAINSEAFLASSEDDRNGFLSSGGVLISVGADYLKIPYVSSGIGVIIATIVIWTGLKNCKDALLYLLDYWNEPAIEQQIRSILEKSRIVSAVKKIRLRHAGTFIFGEAFLEVNPFADLKSLRTELHRLDQKVEENVEHLGDIVLYLDPPYPKEMRVAIPIKKENGLASEIAEDPSQPFQFFILNIEDGKMDGMIISKEIFKITEVMRIAQFLKKENVNIFISSMIGPLLYYNLCLNTIKVYPHFVGVKDVGNTVKLLLIDL